MSLFYDIAGRTVALETASDHSLVEVLRNYSPFSIQDAGAAELKLKIVGSLPQETADTVFSARDEGFPRIDICRRAQGWRILTAPLPHLPICSTIDADEDFACASMAILDPALTKFSVDNALMILYALRTATMGTLEMHASTVVHDGRGYLFLGKSGTGKSTHSRLWLENIPGTWLLNDDNPIVRISGDGSVRVYGSPWSGKTPCYKKADFPIGAIVRIRQAPANSIRRLSLTEAYACVYPSCSGFRPVRTIADGLHESIAAVAAKAPCYELSCLPDADAARLCHAAVTNG